jgi:ribose 5-phosphate isomerase B
MKIAIAADHAGFELKQHLLQYLQEQGHTVQDLGVNNGAEPADYPDVAQAVGMIVSSGAAERGVVICGSGIGACIAANKIQGIYAAIAHDLYSAAQGVEHDNMNVLCLGSRVIEPPVAEQLVAAFLNAVFQQNTERYVRRFHKVQQLEQR